MTANTSERRIERAMLEGLTGKPVVARGKAATGGWTWGTPENYDRALAIDVVQLTAFLEKTQPATETEKEVLDLEIGSPSRQSFLTLIQDEIASHGIVNVLRRGITMGDLHRDLFYGVRTSEDPPSLKRFTQNRFSVISRLRYSADESQPPIDACLFVNGLPIATIELPKQSANDAIERYKAIPASKEPLFQPGRCMAHFAVDEKQAYVCSELRGAESNFQTFNQGSSDDAGNPPNLFGIATEYIWRDILTRSAVVDMIENYAQMFEIDDAPTGTSHTSPVFPRYHQLEVVRRIIADLEEHNIGRRYLAQHSGASESSHSIAWLVSQLTRVSQDSVRIFDTVFVITDRPSLNRQVAESVRNFSRVGAQISPGAGAPTQIHEAMEQGKRVVLANIEQFVSILNETETNQHGRRFAFVLDEASSGQSEDQINSAFAGRGPLPNTSSFVFAPTANATTLELFGQPFNDRGTTRYTPFHSHSS